MQYRVITGDILTADIPGVFDAVLCDPPYGLSFMGKEWDHGVPGAAIWRRVYDHLRPGAHLIAFGGTRTHHRLMVAIEDAGYEIRDCLMWLYGSGFPKSHDISKAIDKAAGAKREVIKSRITPHTTVGKGFSNEVDERPWMTTARARGYHEHAGPVAATPAARTWDGYGTALKPAWEPAILAMRPTVGTFAANAQEQGVAGLNIDGGRVPANDKAGFPAGIVSASESVYGNGVGRYSNRPRPDDAHPTGRWPANVILNPAAADMLGRQSGERPSGGKNGAGTVSIWGRPDTRIGGVMDSSDGTAARFFKTVAHDQYCALCGMISGQKHGIMNETQHKGIVPCESANTAETNTNPNEKVNGSAPESALGKQPPANEGSNQSKSSSALNAVSHLRITPATIPSTVQKIVAARLKEKSVQSARSAASLCKQCGTAIVQNLVAIKLGHDPALIHYPVFMPEHKGRTLTQSLVQFAESQESIDTTLTIPSLKILFGYVCHAIDESTRKEYHNQSGKSHQTRFHYDSKASRRERNAGLEGMEARRGDLLNTNGGIKLTGSGNIRSEMRQNHHPTVKPIDLCQYLATLLLPPDTGRPRRLLVPFSGSGSEMIGALLAGWDEVVGVELNAEYATIANARLEWWTTIARQLTGRPTAARVLEYAGLEDDVNQADDAIDFGLFAQNGAQP